MYKRQVSGVGVDHVAAVHLAQPQRLGRQRRAQAAAVLGHGVGIIPGAAAQVEGVVRRHAHAAGAGGAEAVSYTHLPLADRRFAGEAWAANGLHLLMAHTYLLSARAMSRMVDAAQVSEPMRDRLRFSIMQWVDALSPSNFLALNPDAQQSIVESAGRALNEGLALSLIHI